MTEKRRVQLGPLAQEFLERRLSPDEAEALKDTLDGKASTAIESGVAWKQGDEAADAENNEEGPFTKEQAAELFQAIEYIAQQTIQKYVDEQIAPVLKKLGDGVMTIAEAQSQIQNGPLLDLAKALEESPVRSRQWINNLASTSEQTAIQKDGEDGALLDAHPSHAPANTQKADGPTPYVPINQIIAEADASAQPSS